MVPVECDTQEVATELYVEDVLVLRGDSIEDVVIGEDNEASLDGESIFALTGSGSASADHDDTPEIVLRSGIVVYQFDLLKSRSRQYADFEWVDIFQ